MNSVENINNLVQELKSEYVYDGWEDEYEDIDEAYEEMGRNSAEHQVINELINENCLHLPTKSHHKLFHMLALHYDLQVD